MGHLAQIITIRINSKQYLQCYNYTIKLLQSVVSYGQRRLPSDSESICPRFESWWAHHIFQVLTKLKSSNPVSLDQIWTTVAQ